VEGIFLRYLQPKPFAVFVEGVSQFGKNPVRGFVVLRGQDLRTEFADFGFGGHEVASGKSFLKMQYSTRWFSTVNTVGKVRPIRGIMYPLAATLER
jgi:hypothetical protein